MSRSGSSSTRRWHAQSRNGRRRCRRQKKKCCATSTLSRTRLIPRCARARALSPSLTLSLSTNSVDSKVRARVCSLSLSPSLSPRTRLILRCALVAVMSEADEDGLVPCRYKSLRSVYYRCRSSGTARDPSCRWAGCSFMFVFFFLTFFLVALSGIRDAHEDGLECRGRARQGGHRFAGSGEKKKIKSKII